MFNKSKPTNDNADDSDDTPRILGGGDTAPARGGNRAESLLDSGPRPSVVSEGFSFRGEIDARGALHVQGSVSGQVKVDELTVGNSGELEGTVACTTLTIKGRFSGTAVCSELLVAASASVDGNITYQTLTVQRGASIRGELLLGKA